MRIHYVDKRIRFPMHEADAFHSAMFHGKGERIGCSTPLIGYRYGDKLEFPLSLSKNVHNIGHVFLPNNNFVISDSFKEKVQHLEKIAFLKVDFKKVFFYPALEYDFSYYKTIGDYNAYMSFIQGVPDNLTLHKDLPAYFEMIIPRNKDVTGPELSTYHWIRKDHVHTANADINLHPETVERFGILWDSGNLISENVFQKIERLFNWTYFYHEYIDL